MNISLFTKTSIVHLGPKLLLAMLLNSILFSGVSVAQDVPSEDIVRQVQLMYVAYYYGPAILPELITGRVR